MIRVESSNIEGFDYSQENRELFVTFKSGTEYLYHDVPPEVVMNIIFAESVGSAFHALIKPYKYEKLPS